MTDKLTTVDEEALARCPESMRAGIARYIDHGIRPGGSLCAIIDNNLLSAVCIFGGSIEELRAIVKFFYNDATGPCWGSRDNRHAWEQSGGAMGRSKQRDARSL
jgi:hypothetical protein